MLYFVLKSSRVDLLLIILTTKQNKKPKEDWGNFWRWWICLLYIGVYIYPNSLHCMHYHIKNALFLHASYTLIKLLKNCKTKMPSPQTVKASKHSGDSSAGLRSWFGEHFIHHQSCSLFFQWCQLPNPTPIIITIIINSLVCSGFANWIFF